MNINSILLCVLHLKGINVDSGYRMFCYLTLYTRGIVWDRIKHSFSIIPLFYCNPLNINNMDILLFFTAMLVCWALAILLCKWLSDGDI
nr:MAG TPA: hypothetical protein [Crassvirales sp.]